MRGSSGISTNVKLMLMIVMGMVFMMKLILMVVTVVMFIIMVPTTMSAKLIATQIMPVITMLMMMVNMVLIF